MNLIARIKAWWRNRPQPIPSRQGINTLPASQREPSDDNPPSALGGTGGADLSHIDHASVMFLLMDILGTLDALRVILRNNLGPASALHTRDQIEALESRVSRFHRAWEKQMEKAGI